MGIPKRSRKIRVIDRGSFNTADRGEDWAWSLRATWWHQVRGVKGFHNRIVFQQWPKSVYPEPPTIDEVAWALNELTNYDWAVSE